MPRSVWLSLLIILLGCGKSLPALDNVNLADWKADRNGCLGKRAPMEEAFRKQKSSLLALNETQVVTLLGRPDRNELYKRNQKFYYYFITPSPDCRLPGGREVKLAIRFNAMGLVKEVTIE